MLWFTSDLHFRHENIIRYCNRPFSNTNEMNTTLIENINNTVRKDDVLYILGDVVFGQNKEEYIANLLKAIRCENIYLIKGNHDVVSNSKLLEAGFKNVGKHNIVSYGRHNFVLSHKPENNWVGMEYGNLMLHGHIHSDGLANQRNRHNHIRRYDVGVDANNYFPINAADIISFFGI